jgi:hypothetical protein
MTVLDAYNVHSYGLDERNDVEQLAIQRRDGEAISSLADVQAIREQRAPGARLLIVHLWLHHPARAADDAGHDGGRATTSDGAVAAATTPPASMSIAAPRARRPRRCGGTLNLRDREIGALADLIDAHVDVDDDSPAADALRAVRAKLARLPQAVTA